MPSWRRDAIRERRKAQVRAIWTAVVAGKTIAGYCREHGMARSQAYRILKEFPYERPEQLMGQRYLCRHCQQIAIVSAIPHKCDPLLL